MHKKIKNLVHNFWSNLLLAKNHKKQQQTSSNTTRELILNAVEKIEFNKRLRCYRTSKLPLISFSNNMDDGYGQCQQRYVQSPKAPQELLIK